MAKQLFDKAGGYRRLHSFTYATMIHLETISFCRRFIDWKEDPLGKTVGQMVGAARSGRQNIIEASERAATSKETEIKLTDVARASLAELLGDYEIFLAERNTLPWNKNDINKIKFSEIRLPEFKHSDDELYDYWKYYNSVKPLFRCWFESDKPEIVANAMIILLQRTMAMLKNQVKTMGNSFLREGGFREKMYQCRSEEREKQLQSVSSAPCCPECGKVMIKRNSNKGEFWGCSAYPNCRGTRQI